MTDRTSPDGASLAWLWWLLGWIVAFSLADAGLDAVEEHGSVTTRTCTVAEKDATWEHRGNVDASIATFECGTLEVDHRWTRGEPGSGGIYAALEPGSTYELMTAGWSLPFLSRFPVVVGAPVEVSTG